MMKVNVKNLARENISRILFYAGTFLIFLLLFSCYGMMCLGDEHCYRYFCDENIMNLDTGTDNRVPMSSPGMIIPSQIAHYSYVNGRFIIHCIIQLYVNFWGYKAHIITGALICTLTIFMLCKLATSAGRTSTTCRLIVLSTVLAIMPFFEIRSWISTCSGTYNTALPILAMLLIIFVFRKTISHPYNRLQNAGIFLLALICGSLSEGYSIPVAITFTLYAIFRFRNMKCSAWALYIGYLLGTTVQLLSPANWHRLAGTDSNSWQSMIIDRIYGILLVGNLFYPVILLALTIIILLLIKKTRNTIFSFLRENKLYISIGAFSFLFATAAGLFQGARPYMAMGIMTILLYIKLIFLFLQRTGQKTLVSVRLLCVGIVLYSVGTLYSSGNRNKNTYINQLHQYIESDSGYVVIPDHYEKVDNNPYNDFGPITLNPTDNHIYQTWTESIVKCFYSNNRKPLRFIPDLKSINAKDIIYRSGNITVYSRPDSWWILVTGLCPNKNLTSLSTDYTYIELRWKIKAALDQWFKHKPATVFPVSNQWIYFDNKPCLLISKSNKVTINNMEIYDGNRLIISFRLKGKNAGETFQEQ